MGILRKFGIKGLGLVKSKLGKKAVKKVGGNKGFIKTSVKTTKTKVPALTGGKKVAKSVARKSKALSNAVKLGGAGLLGAGAIAGSGAIIAKSFDYIQDVRFKTPEQRQAEQAFDLYEDIEESSGTRTEIDEDSPSAPSDDGGARFLDFYNAMQESDDSEEDTKQSYVKGAIILASIGAGVYLLDKSGFLKRISAKKK